ncbi:peptide chain release factor N(5)-glutamine methyltransferase [Gordonia sp. (in: high G+C Gram-positive bacteria)]|uniref:peptide chain release factor N(5)-glutamine methyltransferase n=1 Tax=Gordonia sp. (in: high G+C Gram-positive bacteria) TaxID=84139 RepID=UPI00260BD47B|nr:peptide chain release factor N(5)-glutamine methyltransferase [Gordonia sp. (in: high G+C Gram-positive bacteria)]
MNGSVISASALRAAGTATLARAGIDCAAVDAAWLLAHVLGTQPGRLLLIDDVDAARRAEYEALIARRAERIPLQHLTATAHFAGVELAVGPGVFIPRPETELLVEWAAGICAREHSGAQTIRIADLCSGSGALALAIATAVPRARVIAVERSPEALAYLRRNVAAQPGGVSERVRVVAGDVTDPGVWELIGPRQVIVSNPPYVPASSPVSPEVGHDPAEAVFSGESGMDVITAMVPLIAGSLVPGGTVAIEHDDTTGGRTRDVFGADGAFTEVSGHDDLAGRPRYVTARRRPVTAVQGWNA